MIHDMERGFAMKRSKYTEEQSAFALKQAELGTAVPEVFLKMGLSEGTSLPTEKG